MYFDDCERMTGKIGEWEKRVPSITRAHPDRVIPWSSSRSEEKRSAIDRLLGYNPQSASVLSDEKVEEETLRWAVDTNLVWTWEEEDGDGEDATTVPPDRTFLAKYEYIKDLKVASACNTTLESLAFLWDVLAGVFGEERDGSSSSIPSAGGSSSTGSPVHLIVFPKSKPLWDYDAMVTMLQAVQISKPFLPSELELKIDLFHPDYKHSPKMWSPETHSPFPTVGLSVSEKTFPPVEAIDVDAIREKLNALFRSVDATREVPRVDVGEDDQRVLEEAQSWFFSQQEHQGKIEWAVQTHDGPFQLYKTLWNAILNMQREPADTSSVIVAPSLDSHTLHRVAVTVNTALKRLDIPVRITQVYRPPSERSLPSMRSIPYGMIQLTPLAK